MAKRSEVREQAFLLVFESLFEANRENIDELIELYSENVCEVNEYAKKILSEVNANKESFDEDIKSNLKGWKLNRLPKTTLAILYVAIYEIKVNEEVPNSVAINEAVELAKKYSTQKDASFINGILSTINKQYEK